MALNPRLTSYGTAGGTAINVDHTRLEHGAAVKVLLSANYTISREPGAPTRPGMTGAAAASLDYPRVVTSGATLSLLAPEAAALVAAGKASYV